MDPIKIIQMNLFTKQKQTHRHRKQSYSYRKGWRRGGVNKKVGITDTHSYLYNR